MEPVFSAGTSSGSTMAEALRQYRQATGINAKLLPSRMVPRLVHHAGVLGVRDG